MIAMYQGTPLITLHTKWETAVGQAVQFLEESGFQVIRSFDLCAARSVHVDCPCPHHGTNKCDCQMVVLLVYQEENPPVTLVAHGHDSHTSILLVETPQQSLDLQVEETIRHALAPRKFFGADPERWAHAA